MGRVEGRVEDYLKDRVKHARGQHRKVRWIGRVGAPDRLIWFGPPLRQALVEVKSGDGDLSKVQVREIARLRKAGWPVFVVSTREEVDAAIEEIRCCNL